MKSWPTMQLRHQFRISAGATPDSTEETYWDGTILWITPEDVTRLVVGYRLNDTRRKITDEGYRSCATALAPPNSIVLTKRAPIGQLAVLDKEAACNQGCFLLTPDGLADARFFYYLLLTKNEWLQALGRGSTFMELSTDDIKSLRIEVPEVELQCQFADYLDRETARIDSLITEKERLLELLAEKRQALISQAVTRGLDPKVPLRDPGIPWLGKIPKHWLTIRAAFLFNERDERGEPELPLLEVSINQGVVLREFSDDKIESTAADFNTYKVARKGDIVFNKMRMWQGAVGVAPVDGLTSPDYTVAEPTAALLAEYANALFRTAMFSAECARHSNGIVWDRLRLYWEGFREIYVPLPPPNEQKGIVSYLTAETSKLDALRAVAVRTITLLKERRAALISAAVTGKLNLA